MTTATESRRNEETLAELIARLGSISLERIPTSPAPGSATEADVLRRPGGEKRLYELVDGVLVEKPMGYFESLAAAVLIQLLRNFLDTVDLGLVLAPDATLRLAPGLVRLPDVSFVSWKHFPDRQLPDEQIPDLVPDLAVEILSPSNTSAEMDRKVREYFQAGTSLVWLVDPRARTVRVYTGVARSVLLAETDTLDGGDVLPGFQLSVREWFDRATRGGARPE
jgi:Uma2 family endonuclease